MRKVSSLAVVAAFVLFVGGCNRTHEDVISETITKFEDLSKVLEGVKDESSANAAVPKIKSLAADLKKLKAEADKMPKPSADEDKRLKEKYEKRMMEAATKMMGNSLKFAMDPKLAKILEPAMNDLKDIK